MCAMFIIHVAFASVKMAFDSVPLALFSRASGLIGTEYTFTGGKGASFVDFLDRKPADHQQSFAVL